MSLSEIFEWRIRQRSYARPAVQRGGSSGELLSPFHLSVDFGADFNIIYNNLQNCLKLSLCFTIIAEDRDIIKEGDIP